MRRTSEQVTRDLSEEVVSLLFEAKISLHTLAILLGVRDSVLTYWFVRGVRPTQATMRQARNILKTIIAVRSEPEFKEILRDDVAQIRRVLAEIEEAQANAQ